MKFHADAGSVFPAHTASKPPAPTIMFLLPRSEVSRVLLQVQIRLSSYLLKTLTTIFLISPSYMGSIFNAFTALVDIPAICYQEYNVISLGNYGVRAAHTIKTQLP